MSDDYRIALRPDHLDDDHLDDIVVRDVSMFRAELMDDRSMWMCCFMAGSDQRLTLWVRATKRRGQPMRLEVTVTESPSGDGMTYESA